jgi:hypothetical protein
LRSSKRCAINGCLAGAGESVISGLTCFVAFK